MYICVDLKRNKEDIVCRGNELFSSLMLIYFHNFSVAYPQAFLGCLLYPFNNFSERNRHPKKPEGRQPKSREKEKDEKISPN